MAARLLVDTTTRGPSPRACSPANISRAGSESTRYGVCISTSSCAPSMISRRRTVAGASSSQAARCFSGGSAMNSTSPTVIAAPASRLDTSCASSASREIACTRCGIRYCAGGSCTAPLASSSLATSLSSATGTARGEFQKASKFSAMSAVTGPPTRMSRSRKLYSSSQSKYRSW